MRIGVSQPSVSLVIPTKDGARTIGACLDRVLAQEYEGRLDVLVIDSGSSDGTLDEVLRRPAVRLHRIHPAAFDHGDTRNLGAGMTDGDLIAFLVQDAEPADALWLAPLVRNFADPAVAGTFSRVLPRPGAGPLVRRGCEADLCFGSDRIASSMGDPEAWRALDPHELRLRINFNNVSSCVRRSVWERLPFERGIMGEDIKFARAAIEAGHTIVFEPESRVFHSHDYSPRSIYRRTFLDARVNRRHLGRICVARFTHVLVMAWRAWRADLAYLKALRLSFTAAARWALSSPFLRLAEFGGFWRGGRAALRDQRAPARVPCAVPGPLKVLFVAHAFPPDSWGGVEVFTLTLARALRNRGHDVALFVRSPGTQVEEDRALLPGSFDGLRLHRFVNRLAFSGVDETYRFRPAEAAFRSVLRRERPDVVHITHLIHLSTGIIDCCREAGVPVMVTLIDYWARCSRVQLIRPDRTNCTIPPPGLGCAACVEGKAALVDPLARLDRVLGRLPLRWARGVPQTIPADPPGWSKSREDAASLVRREFWMREVLSRADMIMVHSLAMKRSLIEFGIPSDLIVLSECGVDTSWVGKRSGGRQARAPGAPLRVGYAGNLMWFKGLEVVAHAVAGLPSSSVRLHVYGDHEGGADPVAAGECRAMAEEVRRVAGERVVFHGRYHHDDLEAILASVDVLVVPSVWQETYGLILREAFLTRTPVIGSDIAGIAEGIEHDVNGLLFEPRNADDLRRALQRFLDEPDLGARLAAAAPAVKTDAEEAREMEWRYRQLIGAARGRPAAGA